MSDMTRLHVRHDSTTTFHYAWIIDSTHVTQPLQGKLSVVSFICVPCIIREWLCNTSPNYNCTQLFVSFHTWDITCLHVWHDSLTCETWVVDMWDMTRVHVRHDSFTCETWLDNYLALHLNNTEHACDPAVGTWLPVVSFMCVPFIFRML